MKNDNDKLVLITYTNEKVGGYWDGGAKDRFTWTLGRTIQERGREYQKVHGWEANLWYYVAKGKSDKATLANALRRLRGMMKKNPSTFITHYEYAYE